MQMTSEWLSVDIRFVDVVERWKSESSIFTSHNPCVVSHLVIILPSVDCQYCCMEILKNWCTVTSVSMKDCKKKYIISNL